MSHDELSITITTSHEGETIVFKLTGSLDLATSPSVRAALLEGGATVGVVGVW